MADSAEFRATVEELLKGMDSFISSKTVVGEPIRIDDTTIVPIMDVSFAIGAGSSDQKKNGSGGGIGGKMSPSAVLILQNGTTKLVSVKNQDSLTKIVDMVPDLVNKFTSGSGAGASKETPEEE